MEEWSESDAHWLCDTYRVLLFYILIIDKAVILSYLV